MSSPSRGSSSYFTGDCKALDNYLKDRHGPFWGMIKYLNALFRGVGQVVFANNPFSGFIILASLYWASLLVGFATTVAATTAILTAIVFKQDMSKINAGLTTYPAVLVGSITSSLWEPMYAEPVGPLVWGFIVLAAALSVLVNTALVNILGSFKPPLPSLTLAFNIVTILVFTVLQPRNIHTGRSASATTFAENVQGPSRPIYNFQIPSFGLGRVKVGKPANEVDILMLLEGIMLSMGQVYGVQHLKGSVAMYIATILYSPTVCIMSVVGATIGSVFGLVFSAPTYQTVYDGLYGFNPILAAIAVGAFFFVPTSLSFALAVADVALVVLVQMALTVSFTPLMLPFLTFPFVISTLFLLEVTATGDILTRVTKFSYPEQHLREFIAKKHLKPPSSVELEILHRNSDSTSPSAPLLPLYHVPEHHDDEYTHLAHENSSAYEHASNVSHENNEERPRLRNNQLPLNPEFYNQTSSYAARRPHPVYNRSYYNHNTHDQNYANSQLYPTLQPSLRYSDMQIIPKQKEVPTRR